GDLGAQRQQRDDLVGAALDQRPRVGGAHHGGDPAQELSFQGLDRILGDLPRLVEAAKVVDVDKDDDVAAVQRVAQVAGAALRRRLIAVRAVKQVLEVFAADPSLDLGEL